VSGLLCDFPEVTFCILVLWRDGSRSRPPHLSPSLRSRTFCRISFVVGLNSALPDFSPMSRLFFRCHFFFSCSAPSAFDSDFRRYLKSPILRAIFWFGQEVFWFSPLSRFDILFFFCSVLCHVIWWRRLPLTACTRPRPLIFLSLLWPLRGNACV